MKRIMKIFGGIICFPVTVGICSLLLHLDAYDAIKNWGLSHAEGANNSYKSYIGNYEYVAVAMTNENRITQEFELTEAMLRDAKLSIEVLFGAYGRENIGECRGRLTQGERVQEISFEMKDVMEWHYYELLFDTEGFESGTVTLELYSEIAVPSNCVAPFVRTWNENSVNKNDINDYRETDSIMFRNAKVNGMEQAGPLVLRVSAR